MDPKPLATPDVTPAQVIAAITAVVGLFVSQGYVDGHLAQLITGVAAIVLPLVWVVADAIIRHGRARAFQVPPKGVVADDAPPKPVVKPKSAAAHGRRRSPGA